MIRFILPAPVRTAPPPAPALGRDLAFDGKLRRGLDGDYRAVEGAEALRQSLLRRLLTNPGEHAFRANYGAGLKRSVKQPGSRAELDRSRNRVLEQVNADDRVRSAPSVSVSRTPTGIRVDVTVALTDGTTLTLRPFEVSR